MRDIIYLILLSGLQGSTVAVFQVTVKIWLKKNPDILNNLTKILDLAKPALEQTLNEYIYKLYNLKNPY